jgi:NADH-quinone oxidoreductase subunit N
MLYLAIELQSLRLYIFASFIRNSEFSTESGLKYFVFGGIMSCFLLFGICLIYLFFGSLSFELFFSIANSGFDLIFFAGFLFVFIVLMFKVGAAPFHFWLCDVYEGAILPVTLLFASAPKVVLFSIFLKLCCFVLYEYSIVWANLIGLSAVLSIIVGYISGLYQKRLKRLFAFSTIAHAGFVLLALLAFSIDASKSLIFYISVYFVLTITVFSILMNAAVATKIPAKYLINYSSIGSKNYIFAITFCLVILSVAGIPPLAGFFSKLFVLISLIGSQYYSVALIVIIFSTISCFYYIRLVKILFFAEKTFKNDIWITNSTTKYTQNIIGCFLFFILCFFVYPDLVFDFSFVVGLVFF